MAIDKMKIHEFCNDIFDGYEIMNLEVDGDDVILKVKPKPLDSSQDTLEIIDRILEPFVSSGRLA